MTDLFPAADRADRRAARQLLSRVASDTPLTRRHLNEAMVSAFGGSDAEGRWTQRDSFEVLEHALALHIRESDSSLSSFRDVLPMIELAGRLPTQTVRSEDQIEWQQFSTPVDIAAIAVLLANIQPDDVILEPSAGNGLLVAHIPDHRSLHLNELDPIRRGRLNDVFPAAIVTGHDGATLNSSLGDTERPTLILMNPPFSRSLGRGVDDYAAIRHLQAALRRLLPGGRIVAIMPDWFGPSARMRDQYETVLRDVTVRTAIRLEKCYAKHGTSIAIRLFVIDKLPGKAPPAIIQRSSVAELLDALAIAERAPSRADLPATLPKRAPGVSMFRAIKSSRPAPRAYYAPVRNDVLPVDYAKLETPAPLLDQTGVYLPYRPSRIVFDKAGEHPTALVESVAMGSIPAPIPDYVPRLPERTVAERLLSASQLETVVYAGHAWSQIIPGRFKPNKEGVGLTLAEDGDAYRKGFFLGDGTGAGKGRQIAACILDNWLQGRRRNIWVTKNAPLLEDARRDWTALGGLNGDIQPVSNWKIDEPIKLDQGVLLVTYPTLRSLRGDHSRLKQITDWAGADFDGVIAFDEAHEMGGVAGGEGALGAKEGSRQGICGVLLQNYLPNARVLYASATGASDINNLAYAVRLGLWGPETAFADREQFISSIRKGGIAAMELVARDLKATGLYMARALSFAGVEYDILQHELTPAQIEIYDTYADAWGIIHQNMEKALELTAVVDGLENATLNSGAKAAARSRFESTKQRFFGQVLLSMKLPTVIAAAQQHLDGGQSVVMQLVTTAESILDRRLGALSPDERADHEIDLSPREYVIDYLERAFPTRQMRVFTDDTGTPRSVPMEDEAGNPVYNPEAEAARDQMIEQLCALPPIMSALDGLLEHFGHDRVAEVTGRAKRLISGSDGRQKLETRSTRTNQAEAAAFMEGRKRMLVFSDAGGTGRSYHASRDVANQEQRVHLLLEPGWRADRAIQGLGRTHRTHQASTPLFRPVTTNCKGEHRFTSTIARRLDSLGALTRGQRQTGGQNLFDPADNLESEYACAALVSWFHLLVGGKLTSVSHADFEQRTGLELCDKDGVMKDELPPIQRWLNRILALPIGLQNKIFDEFLSLVETRVSAAREAGRLDVGVETILVDKATLIEDTLLRTDPVSGATSHLLTIEIEHRRVPVSLERILHIADGDATAEFLTNTKSGKVALQTRARALMEEKEGTPIPRVELMRPTRREYMREHELFESAWTAIDREAFSAKWREEAEDAANKIDTETVRLATGLLLPIWSALPSDHLVVNRIADKAGNSWLGRLVFDEHDRLIHEAEAIENRAPVLPEELKAHVGAFLLLTPQGEMVLDTQFYSEQQILVEEPTHGEEGEGEDGERSSGGFRIGGPKPSEPTYRPEAVAPGGKPLSSRLYDELAMQRRDILASCILAQPALALDYALFVMVDARTTTPGRYSYNSTKYGTTIHAGAPQDPNTGDMPTSRAREYLAEAHEGLDGGWTEHESEIDRFEGFRALDDDSKANWLAYIVAISLEAKPGISNEQIPLHNRLASILDIDVASWWRPTSENFFDRVNKGSILSLLDEVGGPALSGRHASLKKTEISASCQKLFAGDTIVEPEIKEAALAWVPNAMRFLEGQPEDDLVEADDPDRNDANDAVSADGDDPPKERRGRGRGERICA